MSFPEGHIEGQYEKGNADNAFPVDPLGMFHVAYLDAEPRLLVVKKGSGFNIHEESPESLLQCLFAATDDQREAFADAFRGIFGMDIALDYSGMTTWMLRISRELPSIPEDPRKAYPVLSDFPLIDEQGDGFRSCAAVLLSVLLFPHRIILLDEPDAFLHPAQAKKLGAWISKQVDACEGQVLIATHSASLLAGLVSESDNIDVFRLNRKGEQTNFNKMPASATRDLSRSPLLSSQRVTEAVFHHGVCVCEADADRAFYQTAADKFQTDQQVLYIHAQNKQTIGKVAELLRGAEIPVCSVVDIDILSSVKDFNGLVRAVTGSSPTPEERSLVQRIGEAVTGMPEDAVLQNLVEAVAEFSGQLERGEHDLIGARTSLNRLKKHTTKWTLVKSRGIDGLTGEIRSQAEQLINDLAGKGVFIVPVGELEGWIDLGTRRKNRWIVKALEYLGEGNCPAPLRQFLEGISSFVAPYSLTAE